MKKAIIDASSAILLHKVGLFRHMADTLTLFMSQGVYEEITIAHHSGAGAFEQLYETDQAFGIVPQAVIDSPASNPPRLSRLHRGEQETIRGYLAGAADFVILDDGKGAGFCRRNHIPYINALLCPKLLYFSGIITETTCRRKHEELLHIGRYSRAVIDFASRCSKTDLAAFTAS